MPDITITVNVTQARRISTALGRHLGLTDTNGANRDATAGEVREWLLSNLRQVVEEQERKEAERSISVAPLGV